GDAPDRSCARSTRSGSPRADPPPRTRRAGSCAPRPSPAGGRTRAAGAWGRGCLRVPSLRRLLVLLEPPAPAALRLAHTPVRPRIGCPVVRVLHPQAAADTHVDTGTEIRPW